MAVPGFPRMGTFPEEVPDPFDSPGYRTRAQLMALRFSLPKPTFAWITGLPDPQALKELAQAVSEPESSLADEKQRRISEFRRGQSRAAWRTVVGLLAYGCYYAVCRPVFAAFEGSEGLPFIPIALGTSMLPMAWFLVGRPFFKWIAYRNRIGSLDLARSGAEFLSWIQREQRPFVLYLRDFASWTRPHHISGTLFSTDPLVRELSWILPKDVYLVDLHNVYEAATKAPNIIHILSTDEKWEAIMKSACVFAAMIVIAPRRSGVNLRREFEWIRSSKSLQQKTLLLYEPLCDPAVQDMRRFVRWNAALWRPQTGDDISGLGSLPDALELVRYVFGSV